MDKESKKRLRKEVRARERAVARAALPLPATELQGLFDWLDAELGRRACGHTLELTRAWIERRSHDPSIVVPWLQASGGYCDCEVLANVEQHVEDALHDA